jgi:hypothetical protein
MGVALLVQPPGKRSPLGLFSIAFGWLPQNRAGQIGHGRSVMGKNSNFGLLYGVLC